MTYHLRHHTELLQRKAAKCVPAFTLRNEPYPEHYEAAYAKAMKMLTAREGHMGRAPAKVTVSSPPPVLRLRKEAAFAVLDAEILKAVKDGMSTTEIAAAVSLKMGKTVTPQAVAGRMRAGLSENFTRHRRRVDRADEITWTVKKPAAPVTDLRGLIQSVLADGQRQTLDQICKATEQDGYSQRRSLGNTLRHMCRDNILTRGKFGGCYEYQLAHVSCKDRIAAAVKEAAQ